MIGLPYLVIPQSLVWVPSQYCLTYSSWFSIIFYTEVDLHTTLKSRGKTATRKIPSIIQKHTLKIHSHENTVLSDIVVLYLVVLYLVV